MTAFGFLLAKSAAEEGRDIVLSMLVVGLVILAVVAIGELNDWRGSRQRRR